MKDTQLINTSKKNNSRGRDKKNSEREQAVTARQKQQAVKEAVIGKRLWRDVPGFNEELPYIDVDEESTAAPNAVN